MGINTTYIEGYANSITGLINGILVPVLISLAFIVFLWGVYKYFIYGADDPGAQKSGRTFMLYGIIGFVVLFSVWSIVQIFMGTLNLDDATNAPRFPTIGNSSAQTCYPNPDGSCPAGCKDDFGADSGCIPISGSASRTGGGTTFFPGAGTYRGSTGGTASPPPGNIRYRSGGGVTQAQVDAASQYSNCVARGTSEKQCFDVFTQTAYSPGTQFSSCTGSGQSTCTAGLECIYNICAISPSSIINYSRENNTDDYTGAPGTNSLCTDQNADNYNSAEPCVYTCIDADDAYVSSKPCFATNSSNSVGNIDFNDIQPGSVGSECQVEVENDCFTGLFCDPDSNTCTSVDPNRSTCWDQSASNYGESGNCVYFAQQGGYCGDGTPCAPPLTCDINQLCNPPDTDDRAADTSGSWWNPASWW